MGSTSDGDWSVRACLLEQGRSTDAGHRPEERNSEFQPESYAELMPLEQRTRLKLHDGLPDDALETHSWCKVRHTLGNQSCHHVVASHDLEHLGSVGRSTEARHLAAENLELSRAFGATRTWDSP